MTTKCRRVLLGIGLGFGTIGAILIGFIVVRILQADKEHQNEWPKLKMHLVQTISGDDSALFSKESWTRLKVDFTWVDIYRQVSFMRLDKRYQLIIAKCDIVSDQPLPDLAHLAKGSGKATVMVPYKPERLIDHGEFGFRLAPIQSVSKLFLTYSGEQAETLTSNDSVLQYRLSCNKISIRYVADSPVDIYLKSGDDEDNLRLDILIKKHHGRLYFLFIAPISYKSPVEPISPGELLKD
jgi:hypothetical protein